MSNYILTKNSELYHYGVKGMKWGKRRYQNDDGSLNDVGKKKISKQYRKLMKKANNELSKNRQSMYVDAYNRSADYMNKIGIDEFNKRQEKLYGKKFPMREGYMDDYQKTFDKLLEKNYNKTVTEFVNSNKKFKEAKKLVDTYQMTKWDDLAKETFKTNK